MQSPHKRAAAEQLRRSQRDARASAYSARLLRITTERSVARSAAARPVERRGARAVAPASPDQPPAAADGDEEMAPADDDGDEEMAPADADAAPVAPADADAAPVRRSARVAVRRRGAAPPARAAADDDDAAVPEPGASEDFAAFGGFPSAVLASGAAHSARFAATCRQFFGDMVACAWCGCVALGGKHSQHRRGFRAVPSLVVPAAILANILLLQFALLGAVRTLGGAAQPAAAPVPVVGAAVVAGGALPPAAAVVAAAAAPAAPADVLPAAAAAAAVAAGPGPPVASASAAAGDLPADGGGPSAAAAAAAVPAAEAAVVAPSAAPAAPPAGAAAAAAVLPSRYWSCEACRRNPARRKEHELWWQVPIHDAAGGADAGVVSAWLERFRAMITWPAGAILDLAVLRCGVRWVRRLRGYTHSAAVDGAPDLVSGPLVGWDVKDIAPGASDRIAAEFTGAAAFLRASHPLAQRFTMVHERVFGHPVEALPAVPVLRGAAVLPGVAAQQARDPRDTAMAPTGGGSSVTAAADDAAASAARPPPRGLAFQLGQLVSRATGAVSRAFGTVDGTTSTAELSVDGALFPLLHPRGRGALRPGDSICNVAKQRISQLFSPFTLVKEYVLIMNMVRCAWTPRWVGW